MVEFSVAFGNVGSSLFFCTDSLNKVFLDKYFKSSYDAETNFKEITSVPEIWKVLFSCPCCTHFNFNLKFAEIVLLDGLFGEDPDTQNLNMRILNENLLLGPVRFRQLRVKNDSCEINEIFKNQFKECYSFYSSKASDESSFVHKNSSEWKYQNSDELNGFFTWGQLQLYQGGGFVQNLADSRLETKLIIQGLKDNNWINRGTRVVFIEFVMYNANINKFCNAK